MKRITTVLIHDNVFEIVKNTDGVYCAINHKYLDSNGCLTKRLDGFDMFVSTIDNTLSGLINRINQHFEWTSFIKEHNIDINNPDELRAAVKIFFK